MAAVSIDRLNHAPTTQPIQKTAGLGNGAIIHWPLCHWAKWYNNTPILRSTMMIEMLVVITMCSQLNLKSTIKFYRLPFFLPLPAMKVLTGYVTVTGFLHTIAHTIVSYIWYIHDPTTAPCSTWNHGDTTPNGKINVPPAGLPHGRGGGAFASRLTPLAAGYDSLHGKWSTDGRAARTAMYDLNISEP